jgi:hypothetical protein
MPGAGAGARSALDVSAGGGWVVRECDPLLLPRERPKEHLLGPAVPREAGGARDASPPVSFGRRVFGPGRGVGGDWRTAVAVVPRSATRPAPAGGRAASAASLNGSFGGSARALDLSVSGARPISYPSNGKAVASWVVRSPPPAPSSACVRARRAWPSPRRRVVGFRVEGVGPSTPSAAHLPDHKCLQSDAAAAGPQVGSGDAPAPRALSSARRPSDVVPGVNWAVPATPQRSASRPAVLHRAHAPMADPLAAARPAAPHGAAPPAARSVPPRSANTTFSSLSDLDDSRDAPEPPAPAPAPGGGARGRGAARSSLPREFVDLLAALSGPSGVPLSAALFFCRPAPSLCAL